MESMGSLPVITGWCIHANILDHKFYDGTLYYIGFEMGSPDHFIFPSSGKEPDRKNRTIRDVAGDLKVLAMAEGKDLTKHWDSLDAMLELESPNDYYGADRGSYIVNDFLGGLRYWRSPRVVPLREELKTMLGK